MADLLSHRLPALSPRQANSREEKVILNNSNLKNNTERITGPEKYVDEKNEAEKDNKNKNNSNDD